jgi:DNA-binding LytR/AlgR family response regulator
MIAIALDDEPPALKTIERYAATVEYLDLKKTFTNPVDAIKYLKKFPVDLLFIDIQMPGFNGMDVYKNMQTKPLVVFTTAYSEYAVEGFNVNAVDYLLKPFTLERFTQAVHKAFDQFKNTRPLEQNKYISIRSNYSLTKVLVDEITLIESFDDYLNVEVLSGKKYVVRMTMKKIMEQLPAHTFIRVHRSFIVPLEKIENVRNKVITLGSHKIPIGNKYEKEFFSVFRGDM